MTSESIAKDEKRMIKLIVDPGSTHMAKYEYAKELIDIAEPNANAIKFQLFKNLPPNIALPYTWFPKLKEYGDIKGIEVFASVWDREGMMMLSDCGCKYIKFAYSQRYSTLIKDALEIFDKVFISGDVMTVFPTNDKIIKLYSIPEYPVRYKIDFEGLFPDRFDGFSDHTLGYSQTLDAAMCGAGYIEKHITLDKDDVTCPDARFALNPSVLNDMAQKLFHFNGETK